MIAGRSPFPGGVVGIISSDLSRFPEFTQCLERLFVPQGTTWEWVEGVGFARNRNEIIRAALAKNAQWIWFVDDDNTFAPDVLMKLLDRKVDVIMPLICKRKAPFTVHAYRKPLMEGGSYIYAPWDDIPETGISRWDAVSTSGCLIQRKVFEAMSDPWFEEGKTKADEPGEDLHFCSKAQRAGFEIWLDSETEMGHMAKMTVFGRRFKGMWCHEFEVDKGFTARLPVNR